MQQHRMKKKVLSVSVACALALGLTPAGGNAVYAAGAAGQAAAADKDYSLEAVTVEAKRPDWESKLSPGTVTVIRPDDYKGEQKTLPELLKMVPGVHVREVNGKGQYTTVSVRGSTAAQVGVFVDGILTNLGGDAAVDISTIPVGNVERIEVYRGYIPARFGGTYMGGVINVVTKRPTKANVDASVGQSSYGGFKGSLQIDAPLGSGSLMVGINHDESDGDFKYKFKPTKLLEERYDNLMKNYQDQTAYAIEGINNGLQEIHLTDSDGHVVQVTSKAEYDALMASRSAQIEQEIESRLDFSWLLPSVSGYNDFMDTSAVKQQAIFNDCKNMGMDVGASVADLLTKMNVSTVQEALAKMNGYSSVKNYAFSYASYYQSQLLGGGGALTAAEQEKLRAQAIKDPTRWRKANDYNNTDILAKWQDEHWLAKVSWKQIKRHLPFPVNWNYSDLPFIDTPYAANNPIDIYYHRNQKLTDTEMSLGRRDTAGNLEWGWSVDYLDQHKDYFVDNWQWVEKNSGSTSNIWSPNTLWSKYGSRRWNEQVDGTYKAGDRHLFEFLVNYSKEQMNIDGWKMKSYDFHDLDTRKRWRNYYEQELFNAQLQDTIMLNKAGDFWLTPSVRFNRSTIYGLSENYKKNEDPQHVGWLNREDEQIDQKTTWQLALKKQFSEKFTLRATGGTYYRLLNMYEIAGDGAALWPMPNVGSNGTEAVFPRPEEGSQWDVSAIWDGKCLGAETAKFQITYFGRDSKRLLQMGSWNNFFFVYFNGASARVDGTEIQADLSWKKWDMNVQFTYTKPSQVEYDWSALPGSQYVKNSQHIPGFLTYLPDWEGTARFTYRPNQTWSMFTQFRYVGEMNTNIFDDNAKQSSLLTLDLGVKYAVNKKFQATIGVNDVFDKAADMYRTMLGTDKTQYNIEYPIAGRTYYATIQYKF